MKVAKFKSERFKELLSSGKYKVCHMMVHAFQNARLTSAHACRASRLWLLCRLHGSSAACCDAQTGRLNQQWLRQ